MEKANMACENGKTKVPSCDRIIILTGFGRNLLKLLLVVSLLLFTSSMLFLNWPILTENPFSSNLRWNIPVFACRNINNTAVVDRNGKRIVILDSDGKIRSVIRVNPFSKRAISYVMDLDMDDRYIYILDLQLSANGVQVDGERVLVYDLDGKYVKTAYQISHPDAKQREQLLCDVSCYNGKIFVSKHSKGKLELFQIQKNELQLIQTLSFPEKEIFKASFMPDTKSTFVITRDARCYLNYLNNLEEIPVFSNGTHWNDVCISTSGERYYLNTNQHEIIQILPNAKGKKLIQLTSRDIVRNIPNAFGQRISFSDDSLLWCSSGRNELISINISTGERTVCTQVPYTISFLVFRWFIWLCAISLMIYLGINITRILFRIVRDIRHAHDAGNPVNSDYINEALTIWGLYGRNAFILTFAFIAVTCVISFFYVDHVWKTMESSLRSTASELRNLPGTVFGDYLAKINSPDDYNSKAFKIMRQVGSSISFSEEGAEFDLGLSVFRKLSDGKYMYVIDTFDRYCIGKIIDKNDPDLSDLYRNLNAVKNGKILSSDFAKRSGYSIFYVLSQIYDSDGKEAGIIIISCNRDRVYQETFGMVSKLSIDLLLLFIIFVFLSGEIKLILDFRKFRKFLPGTNKLAVTVCEGHRSCSFLTSMSLYLDVAFLPTLAIALAKQSDVSGNISSLAAIPLTCRNFMLMIALVIGGFLSKYAPAKFLKCSALLSICCYFFQIHAVVSESYFGLLVSVASLGIMIGLKICALNAVGACGLQPDHKFRNFVYVNTESLIGAAVGTSIGSLLCEKAGYVSVFVFGILLELILYILTGWFIADDINLKKSDSLLQKSPCKIFSFDWIKLKGIIRHIFRPDLFVLLVCVMIPINILGQFDSYVLPIYNVWFGSPQILTGFIGTVTKVLALILIPYVFNRLASKGNRLPIFVGMSLLVIAFFLFAFDSSPSMMGLLLLIITIYNIIFSTASERLRLAMAEQDNLKYSDVAGFCFAFQYLGASVAPLLMGACLNFGFRNFSIIFGSVLFIMLLIFICFSSSFRRANLGKTLE